MVTDKLGSDGAARSGMRLNAEHRQHMGLNHMGLNNRAEKPGRECASAVAEAQEDHEVDHEMDHEAVQIRPAPEAPRLNRRWVANLHTLPRQAMSSSGDRALRSEAMVAWREIAEPGVAAQRQEKGPVCAWPPFGKLTVPSQPIPANGDPRTSALWHELSADNTSVPSLRF
jgi:hypothetical protein